MEIAEEIAEKFAEPEPEVVEAEPAEAELLEGEVGRAVAVAGGFFAAADVRVEREREAGPLMLSKSDPYTNGQKLVAAQSWHTEQAVPTLRFWQGTFWNWDGFHWSEVPDKRFRNHIWRNLALTCKHGRNGRVEPFEPEGKDVSALIDALAGYLDIDLEMEEMPGWFGDRRPQGDLRELVAVQNGLLHLETRRLYPHSPRFWSANVLPYAFDPTARAPRFKQFLLEVWPGDEEMQQALLEMYGVWLTDVTKFQKWWMFVGPPRGGRGTIGRVLKGLIGDENFLGGSLKDLGERFGMEGYVGKKGVVYSDAKLDGISLGPLTKIAERIQNVTGEDPMRFDRKFKKYYEGTLTARIAVFTNEVLKFQDETGALASRLLIFRMREQFKDARQDPDLTPKLLAERPGIFNLALAALDGVRNRGALIQPASGADLHDRFTDQASHTKRFVTAKCVLGTDEWVPLQRLYVVWKSWCDNGGIKFTWPDNVFSEKLCAAFPSINRSRPREWPDGTRHDQGKAAVEDQARPVVLFGVGLMKKVRQK